MTIAELHCPICDAIKFLSKVFIVPPTVIGIIFIMIYAQIDYYFIWNGPSDVMFTTYDF